ncbi:hypothetical protein N7486_001042 [Penicillium sp. IBT 16267x]|nr:hypothetical protein N7486_001042 [Penicillium sp. IBT 16267x]
MGPAGSVTHLFFCCSFVIPEGQSLINAFGGNDLPWFRVSDDKLEVNVADLDKIVYNDCDNAQIERAVASLRPHSYQNFHSTAKGFWMRTETVDASHSPFFSRPDELTAAIRRAAGESI